MDYLSFGPVPSRRLGNSLGVNNIPPKVCSYSCVYCQLGITFMESVERRRFHEPEAILKSVTSRLDEVESSGGHVDYITFVPDGEPTLDRNLGMEIELARDTGVRTAVITNASLLWMEDVRADLMPADWVSLKVDTVNPDTWRQLNRPNRGLSLSGILEGIRLFSDDYRGTLATETMLVPGLNDRRDEALNTAEFLSGIDPDISYISIPTRPPAEKWVKPPEEEKVNSVYQIFDQALGKVECLLGYEGDQFTYTGDLSENILAITSVHPMRREGIEYLLRQAHEEWDAVEHLLAERLIMEVEYEGVKFYVRRNPEL